MLQYALQNALQILSTIGILITATGVIFAVRQIRADRERSRRQNAIDLMRYYNGVFASSGGDTPIHRISDLFTDDQVFCNKAGRGIKRF